MRLARYSTRRVTPAHFVSQVTVGSEIKRGYLEISAVAEQSKELDFQKFELQLRAVIERNRNANTDTDGFMIGARLNELLHSNIRLNVVGIDQFNDQQAIVDGRNFARFCYTEIKRLEQKLGLDDESVLSALQFKPENEVNGKQQIRSLLASYR